MTKCTDATFRALQGKLRPALYVYEYFDETIYLVDRHEPGSPSYDLSSETIIQILSSEFDSELFCTLRTIGLNIESSLMASLRHE